MYNNEYIESALNDTVSIFAIHKAIKDSQVIGTGVKDILLVGMAPNADRSIPSNVLKTVISSVQTKLGRVVSYDFVEGSAISNVLFSKYKMLYVDSNLVLQCAEIDLLNLRKNAIHNYVHTLGGSIVAFAED